MRRHATSPRRRHRLLTVLLAILAVSTLAVGSWVGWLSPVRPWQQATGWDRIPLEERATAQELWRRTTGEAPPPRLLWLGHAGFLLQWQGQKILLDPHTSRFCTIAKRLLEPSVPLSKLGKIDAVVISHAHYDHLDLPTLSSLSGLGAVVLPAGSEGYLPTAAWGAQVVPLDRGGRHRCGALEVIAVPAAHNGNRFHPLVSRHQAWGYIIRSDEDALYYAGDTGYGPHFAAIRQDFHPRVAILPIGAYAPRFPLQRYHLSPEQAVRVAAELAVETVVPCHFGTFTLSLDRPAWALPRFARAARRQGLRWMMPTLLRDVRQLVGRRASFDGSDSAPGCQPAAKAGADRRQTDPTRKDRHSATEAQPSRAPQRGTSQAERRADKQAVCESRFPRHLELDRLLAQAAEEGLP